MPVRCESASGLTSIKIDRDAAMWPVPFAGWSHPWRMRADGDAALNPPGRGDTIPKTAMPTRRAVDSRGLPGREIGQTSEDRNEGRRKRAEEVGSTAFGK